ncbi:RNA polymerase subunit sigma [Elizabethkingia anophelis]|uniref:RNA polymerase sigma factor n=1 Tax=Elizabethkingia anophelis NUHP1 TaxID=1338011 RepID=A0A077EGK3_9FLAO|nr:sigma-70 family RNA polymerase sigma factor [Elizabethkingia anophelis]AIL44645.1 sigma factor [Elizabethkingia anophelis NUHP1]AVF46726.1 RNA polymerase subunit sigma [Elizabethkingia anophelis]AVF50716.1 RNA polymerase subunit sigma [Elizabethkingia anophelis]MBE9395031.1 sigma-70 family RNA polymerase sigma factor [Elizabethkingia anophelis]MBE9408926.1 sigma-70 family RNA polymerase sigma factor [Elizabethkingia anophelis]
MHATKQLEEWIDLYGQKLFDRAFYLLSSREDAEDIVQEVYVAAYSAMDNFQEKSSPLTWLMGILQHKVTDLYRKKYKGNPQISLDHFFDNHEFWKDPDGILKNWDTSDASLLDNEVFNAYLEKCLEELPDRWLTLVKLTYLQEKKSTEICQETNISATNYWKILQRSRLQLRECLQFNWFGKEK